MKQGIKITLSDWVVSEIIGSTENRSAKIEELIIKGFMAEKFKAKEEISVKENAQTEILARDLVYSEKFPRFSL